jgi:phospholipase/carboxylesterase
VLRSAHGLCYLEREAQRETVGNPPVLILLHGFASYQNYLFDLTEGFDPRFHVVSVQAPIRMGPGAYRWFYFDYYGTIARRPNEGPTIDAEEEATSLAKLTQFLEGFAADRRPSRLYLLGHSQGGTMALSVALTRPELISGCAEVSGRILARARANMAAKDKLAGLPFFIGHGLDNPIVPIALGRATAQRLRDLQARLCYREYPLGHEITAEILADMSSWFTALLDESEGLQQAQGKRWSAH